MGQPAPHERLDAAMNERRLALHRTWREVAEAARITYEALRAIRRGDSKPTQLTARGLDGALDWEAGSVLKVLAGGQPTPVADETSTAEDESPALTAELALAQRLLAATVREMDLTPEEADEVWRRVRREIEVTARSHKGDAPTNDRNHRAG
ncbi:helix-turn-helix transcriptional regulator [Streptomyces longwoodensis]|uniref:helix-turn-helix domain-containing protein n=1 Tax=Streptomyces longwoodensis TaxID=68231 RepID=UPI0033C1B1F1